MSRVLSVAWREFKATALTKAFLFGAIVVPLLMVGLGGLAPLLLSQKPAPLTGTIALIDPGTGLDAAARIELDPETLERRLREKVTDGLAELRGAEGDRGGATAAAATAGMVENMASFLIRLEIESHADDAELDGLKTRLREGDLVAIAQALPEPEGDADAPAAARAPAVRVWVRKTTDMKHVGLIESSLARAAQRARLVAAGFDVDRFRRLAKAPPTATVRLAEDGSEVPEGTLLKAVRQMIPFGFMMLLWMGSFVGANYLLTTTIEEKSSKVMEVLLSAVSPMQLMAGKIIGQGLVGLVMMATYGSVGIAALGIFAYADIISWLDLLWLALFYVMAYFMIASMMAAIGSAVNELREAQSLMTPAMLVLMAPLFVWLPISQAPNGLLATITGFTPPLIPFVMVLRIGSTEPIPLWQILTSLVVGYAAMVGMVWLAAKVFRVGVLMYGKPPSVIELVRWIRYS